MAVICGGGSDHGLRHVRWMIVFRDAQGDLTDRPAHRAHGSAALLAWRKATCVL
ncbi:hypothetical protein ACFFX0_31635 [Citricoccus parietis]|uniref:Uncharacterized protein n=1 Tax=Citricoccus parietis TaxID=592307 RepID=A0ABV5G9B8_9MICC